MTNEFLNDLFAIKYREGKTEKFKYDERGNIIELSDKNYTQTMQYDDYNNTTSNIYKYSDGSIESLDIENTYDDNCILRSQKTTSKDTDYKNVCIYDEKGRFIFEGMEEGNPDWSKNISYDDESNKTIITMPSLYNYKREEVNYDLDNNQYIQTIDKSDDEEQNQKTGFEIGINNNNRDTMSKYSTSINHAVIFEEEYDKDTNLLKKSEYHLKTEEYIDHDSNGNIINIDRYDINDNCNPYDENCNLQRDLVSSIKRELQYDDQDRIIESKVIANVAEDIPSTGWYKDDSITNLFDSYSNRFK